MSHYEDRLWCIGDYEVVSDLATGGMAKLYLARRRGPDAFERYVVLKTIIPHHADHPSFIAMFLDEAKVAAALHHQNVVQIYDVGEFEGTYFMAIEYVHGETVSAIIGSVIRQQATLPLEVGVTIASRAAAALHYAHECKTVDGPLHIVHRDVSPSNIMVGYDGGVKVLDFGIAKAAARATKTSNGTIKGKSGYMSPEQCMGKPVDRRSDVFGLGICLYELTTLQRAFKGKDEFETMHRIVSGQLTPPSDIVRDYPQELERIVLTALATKPDARFRSAQEMLDALDMFAVRSELGHANSMIARFMIKTFGNKREPWIAARSDTGAEREKTDVDALEREPPDPQPAFRMRAETATTADDLPSVRNKPDTADLFVDIEIASGTPEAATDAEAARVDVGMRNGAWRFLGWTLIVAGICIAVAGLCLRAHLAR